VLFINPDSSHYQVIGYDKVKFSVEKWKFLHYLHNDSGTHALSYSVFTMYSFFEGKRAGIWSWSTSYIW